MDAQSRTEIKAATGWIIALSIGLIILGIAAILMPGLALTLFTSLVGWLVLIGGVLQIVQAFKAKALGGTWLSLGVGIFYTVAGLYTLLNPIKTAAVFAFAFGLLFIAEGIFTIVMAFVFRVGGRLSWFVAINGIITLILGILVINRWPIGAIWLIGVYVGLSLLFSGASLLGAALAARQDVA